MYKTGDYIKFNVDKHVYGLFYGIILAEDNNKDFNVHYEGG